MFGLELRNLAYFALYQMENLSMTKTSISASMLQTDGPVPSAAVAELTTPLEANTIELWPSGIVMEQE